jgi:2-succinyl-5-enolpyruvyl-6-hydroxy-3-cyclohexene-1-carboxylate synthase
LTLAFFAHPRIRVFRHLDERSAAFFGLGLALAQDSPVALVCTSGTAAANFYPAIIEAYHSNVPLLVLTADRPPELRHSGANQTIDQVKMYGDHVLWSVDVSLPQTNAPPIAIRNLRTLAARAYARVNGLVKGPVHLNFPFRKPLEPEMRERPVHDREYADDESVIPGNDSPFTRFSRSQLDVSRGQLEMLLTAFERCKRGLIICGPRCPGGQFPEAVSRLSRISNYPIFADPLSGTRFGPHVENTAVIGGYDAFLSGGKPPWQEPQLVIRFGNVPTSKALNTYLEGITPIHRIHISENGIWSDDQHRVSHFLQADPTLACQMLVAELAPCSKTDWAKRLESAEAACWRAMDEGLGGTYFDGAVVSDAIGGLPSEALLFAGNSLPVRHLDQFGRPSLRSVRVFANRGASGIDGNVSTALGIRAASKSPLVALLGDITFYHDLNGLLMVRELGLNGTIVLLNNNGGGIFRRLPIARFEPPFTELFTTPHSLDFEPVARMYGLEFVRTSDSTSFRKAYAESVAGSTPRVIEVRTEIAQDHARWQEVNAFVNSRINERFAAH